MTQRGTDRGSWPDLPYPVWRETCTTLHLWTQIVGKIRLSQTPWLNHSWQVPLYVTARGLTTSPIPYGERAFQIDLDFIDHAWMLGFRSGDNVADVRPDIRVVFLKIFVRMFRQAFKKIDDVLSDCLVSRTRSMRGSLN